MDSLDEFLLFHIDKLTAGQDIPIDLNKVAAQTGATIEEREMIPEAAVDTQDGHFHIYVQNNFREMPGASVRSRFSLAHEIGHTLFFELRDGQLKPRKDAPRGDDLEMACNRAAGMILVPTKALRRELRQHTVLGADAVVSLAAKFQVSPAVMLRRLHDTGAFEVDWSPVLTSRTGEVFTIEFAPYPPWLKGHIVKPSVGQNFMQWFGPAESVDGLLARKCLNGTLEAEPIDISRSKTIFGLRFRST